MNSTCNANLKAVGEDVAFEAGNIKKRSTIFFPSTFRYWCSIHCTNGYTVEFRK